MAFTVHWPNCYGQRYPRNENAYHNVNDVVGSTFLNRICGITPPLSIQADTLYPNADASVTSEKTGEIILPPGCVGHQLDNPFPVASRTPIALPLIMYPSEETDSCALPVLNWEAYVYAVHYSAKKLHKYYFPSAISKEDKARENALQRVMAIQEAKNKATEVASETPLANTSPSPYLPKNREKLKTHWDTRRALIASEKTADTKEAAQNLIKQKRSRINRTKEANSYAESEPAVDTEDPQIPKIRSTDSRRPSGKTVKKFMDAPRISVKASWNYLYNGTGACNYILDKARGTNYLFVGNGAKLRMLSLTPSKSNEMLSCKLAGVWEEEEVPSNVDLRLEDSDDPLSSQIYQIKTLRKRNLIGVRRGKSVEMYVIGAEGLPSLLASIPNVGYCGTKYGGLSNDIEKPNPMLTSFDLNPNFPSELVTVDENAVIQFIDFAHEKVTGHIKEFKKSYPTEELFGPQNLMNNVNGVNYVSGHPEVILYWSESAIQFHDRRVQHTVSSRELFTLHSSSTLSFSDQEYFRNKNERLDEYISTLTTSSANPLHFYFGTTQRILLMDIRVPRNPVIKISHGLASPPAYMDVLSDDNFETLVAGSQRNSETFCAFFDRSHVACQERPECQRRNPILQSHPRHLSSAREFSDFVEEQGMSCAWQADFERTKARCNAWTTGFCLMKPSKLPRSQAFPSPFILFNGNAFGDVFIQEWDQEPLLAHRKVDVSDERLRSFMAKWRVAMESPLEIPPAPPMPARYVDHSLLFEAAAEGIKNSEVVRSIPFDCFTPHALVYDSVRKGLPSVTEQVKDVDVASLVPRAQTMMRHWTGEEQYECNEQLFSYTTPQTRIDLLLDSSQFKVDMFKD